MPNPRVKGVEKMCTLARVGGLKSAETRQLKRVERIVTQYAREQAVDLDAALPSAGPVKRPNRSGGSHDTDWRCPKCRRFYSFKRRMCPRCELTPPNGRMTRARLRERTAEHRTQAILAKHGL